MLGTGAYSLLPQGCFARPVPPARAPAARPPTVPTPTALLAAMPLASRTPVLSTAWHSPTLLPNTPLLAPIAMVLTELGMAAVCAELEPFATEHQHQYCSQEQIYSLSLSPTHTSPSIQGPKTVLLWGVQTQQQEKNI